MAEKNIILSLKSSKKTVLSDVHTLTLPNVFGARKSYFIKPPISSPSFAVANTDFRFEIDEEDSYTIQMVENVCQVFTCIIVRMLKLSSQAAAHRITHKIPIQSPDGYISYVECGKTYFSEDDRSKILTEFNVNYYIFKEDTLIVSILLIWDESEVDVAEIPHIKDFHHEIAESWNGTQTSLKSSKNALPCEIYTLKLPNLFTLPEYDGTPFEIDSPSFEFDNAKWCFRVRSSDKSNDGYKEFGVYLVWLNFEDYHDFSFKISLLDSKDEIYDYKTDCFCGMKVKEHCMSLFDNTSPTYVGGDTLTLIIHLYQLELKEKQVPIVKDKDFNLLWRDYNKLLLTGKNHDLILRVAEKEFRVHRNILSARSDVFEAMLSQDKKEKCCRVVDVEDCDPEAMEQFLIYVYCGKVESLTLDNVFGLYHIADRFNTTLLKETCIKFIKRELSPSVFGHVMQLALNHRDTKLLEFTTKYFVKNTSNVVSTEGWVSFMKLNSDAANELLNKASK